MKQIIIALVLIGSITTAFGQNKWQQKQINYFVEAATKEYNLNEGQVKELHDARVEMVNAYSEAGTLSDDDRKAKVKEIAQNFQKVLGQLTGKTYAEFSPFLDRMREELKNIK